MQRSSFGLNAFINDPNRATPHRWNHIKKQWQTVTPKANYYQLAPAAGANASLADMTQWLIAQLGHRPEVLNQEQLDNIQHPQIKTSKKHAHYNRPAWRGVSDTPLRPRLAHF